jgi:isoquinoline 1-oxidoreductase beta subunit
MSDISKVPLAKKRMTRRGFLILLGAGAAGLYLGVRLAAPPIRLGLAEFIERSGGPGSRPDGPPDAWFEISPENRVRIFLPKSEMGQGIHSALAQIAAEEMELDWTQIEVAHASTGQGLDDPVGTSASSSVSSLYQPLREAAATMRELLRAEAALQLSVAAGDLNAAGGVFTFKRDASKSITYGQLWARAGSWDLPKEPPPLKPAAAFQMIGKALPRLDLEEKITGAAVFGYDVRLEGMLYGAVARPRTIEGKLRKAAAGEAAEMPGVVKVVIEKDFAGVVAHSRPQAYAALEKLALEWDEGRLWQQAEIEDLVTVGNGAGVTIQKEGDPDKARQAGPPLEAEYRTPLAYHAYLEPLAAAADVRTDSVHVWAATQTAVSVRKKVAVALKRKEETVFVTPVYLGGGLGRKIDATAAVDAARLSAVVGKPVHLGLYRPQDFRNGFVRPNTHHLMRGWLDAGGNISLYEHLQASGEVAFPFLPGVMEMVMGADFGSWRGALVQYGGIPNRLTTAWLAKLPVATGWWRGLGLLPNIFAIESFMDELAFAAQADPLEFRLRHLGDSDTGVRIKRALQAAAEKAGWGQPLPVGHGLGIAFCLDVKTVVAEVAEVSLEDGRIRVHKVTAAVDPGLVINPAGVEAQVIGGITMGVSAALYEQAAVRDGVLEAANFDAYPLLRHAESPDIEVVVLSSGEQPYGMGEPPIGPVAAAIANAVFAASGQRLRRIPLNNLV